ncbi:hypothetical protein [Novosphingobium sp. P6W]|uniref:Cap15 family cyclic dinucleotide receptor domain-containing protein n=1 Tax=Novosphingobium sp. P6W TaxID=1609758 RepID=UPI0005C2D58B|nr:hypothetical protein [Novosphingobium sp. P6W]KIS34169.1 hypothetical protein TQ38_00435 [Novosphingobium sp. P6W]
MTAAPDIAGNWALHGSALGPEGDTLYEWDGEMTLAASAESFAVAIETKGLKTSRSISFAEKLTALPSGEWHLRYGYEADQAHFATESHTFFGLSQLTFAPDLQSAEGTSCNYNGRYVVMQLQARRQEPA